MERTPIQKGCMEFALAAAAGMAIGIGGIVFLSMENKTAGALMFTVGLYTICAHGLNLFTGKVGYLAEQPPSYLFDLLVIWIGNLAGAAGAAYLASATRIRGIEEKAAALCGAKLSDGLPSLFILGVFCGFLMFSAVDGYKKTNHPAILFMGVASFILCGFEHSIADMFYITAARAWSGWAFICILVISFGNAFGAILIPLAKKIDRL